MNSIHTSQSVGIALTLASLFYSVGCRIDTTNSFVKTGIVRDSMSSKESFNGLVIIIVKLYQVISVKHF